MPKPFNEDNDVVEEVAVTIYANANPCLLQLTGKVVSRELHALCVQIIYEL